LDNNKRKENEKKYSNFEELTDGSRMYWFEIEGRMGWKARYGSRMYWFEIEGRMGWKARYIKIVDASELTVSFRQEIFNENGILVEIHEKYPIDNGHIKIENP